MPDRSFEVKELMTPLRVTVHRDLRRFHQQKPVQHVALLADVSKPVPIPARLFLGNLPDITGALLAAAKTFGSSDHQLESQCRQWTDSGMHHQPPRHRTLLYYFLFQRTR